MEVIPHRKSFDNYALSDSNKQIIEEIPGGAMKKLISLRGKCNIICACLLF